MRVFGEKKILPIGEHLNERQFRYEDDKELLLDEFCRRAGVPQETHKKETSNSLLQSVSGDADKATINMEGNDIVDSAPNEDSADFVYDTDQQMPSFKGGDAALMEWLSKNIRYPVEAEKKGIQGRVVVSLVIERNGAVSNVKIVTPVEPSLDNEAVRVMKSMPKWNPGIRNGEKVRVRYVVPVTFRLQ